MLGWPWRFRKATRAQPRQETLVEATQEDDAARQKRLFDAAEKGDVDTLRALLAMPTGKDDVEARDQVGKTVLHYACERHRPDAARELLMADASLHAKDEDGLGPLHLLLKCHGDGKVDTNTLHTLRVLVEFGATLDAQCDEIVTASNGRKDIPALGLCLTLWAQEHADGIELSDIPIESIQRGVESTQTYINSLKRSFQVGHRHKICLVGPNRAGKTSFVKSITTSKPQLEHIDTRTIGIDQYPLRIDQYVASREKPTIHELIFWDFAGEDAYQVAHSLFYSPRTLYFVFVDLEAFAIAYKQAVLAADNDVQVLKLLNEFFERAVLPWVRQLARHPEVEFIFTATKEDLLHENEFMKHVLKQELQRRLEGELNDLQATTTALTRRAVSSHQAQRWIEPFILYSSCLSDASVKLARAKVEALIAKSDLSFPMPDDYSNMRETIVRVRDDARNSDVKDMEWVTLTFAPVNKLLMALEELEVEQDLGRIVLQTLHDLGDVLWFESLNIDLFRETVILDPMLLIEFVRQIITHEHTGIKISHADLGRKPFWRNLGDDRELMKAMKQLMQFFGLVYSDAADRAMEWDSHLIVPAYWKTREPAARRFPSGGLLKTTSGTSEGDLPPRVRVRWDYHIESALPSTVFDDFVVKSAMSGTYFDAGPDWLLHEDADGLTACRVMIGRDRRSLHRTIHVEAVVANNAYEDHESHMWDQFQQFVGALVLILREHDIQSVSCNAWDDAGTEYNLKTLLRTPRKHPSWMPPVDMYASLQL